MHFHSGRTDIYVALVIRGMPCSAMVVMAKFLEMTEPTNGDLIVMLSYKTFLFLTPKTRLYFTKTQMAACS